MDWRRCLVRAISTFRDSMPQQSTTRSHRPQAEIDKKRTRRLLKDHEALVCPCNVRRSFAKRDMLSLAQSFMAGMGGATSIVAAPFMGLFGGLEANGLLN